MYTTDEQDVNRSKCSELGDELKFLWFTQSIMHGS